MAEPSVLLLDEPLIGLSPAAGQSVLAQLRFAADECRTVLVVEANRAAVASYADHMIEIIDGKAAPCK